MLFGRKKRGHSCMRCGKGKKIDGDELICSFCIDEITLQSASSPSDSGADDIELPVRIAHRASA